MSNIYRLKYKRGDLELDIESTDKEYIDRKLAEIQKSEDEVAANGKLRRRQGSKRVGQRDAQATEINQVAETVLADIIAGINDAENYEDIGKYVLDRSDRKAKILLCFYFAHQHPTDPALTTTHVEQITAQLGIKIAQPNVAKVIRQTAGQYLTADRVRRRGFAVHYRINRRGIAAFEQVVAGGQR
jgi:hypothetical protein